MTNHQKHDDAALVGAARGLHEAIERIEELTGRIAEVRVTSRTALTAAGELLDEAAQGHRDFLSSLATLIEAVGALRERQNTSAATLSSLAEGIDERRQQSEALEQRFASLGQDAQAIAAELSEASGPNGESDPGAERLRAALPAIRDKLAAALDTAAALTTDARAAELSDLAEQAHSVSQQLEALLRKLESAPAPGS